MTAIPPDNDHRPPSESVQQYLDLLLSSATEKAEAQIDGGDTVNPEVSAGPVGEGLTSDTRAAARRRRASTSPPTAAAEPSVSANTAGASPILDSEPVDAVQPRRRRKSDGDIQLPRFKEAKQPGFQIPLPSRQPTVPVPSVVAPVTAGAVEETPGTAGDVEVAPIIAATEQQQISKRPVWGEQRFECLLFTVGGLTLAVPLTELGAIYPLTEEITPIFGQVDWFLGLLPLKERNIRVVNTAKVVMPERYCEAMIEKYDYVISLNGVDWALAVDGVSESISLEPDNIRWSSKSGKRPWLAGTVIEHMCALLDVSQLAAMFTERESSSTDKLTR